MMRKRLEKVRDILVEEQIDALLITKKENRHYVSGFRGCTGMLVITADKAILITDFRYLEEGEQEALLFEIKEFSGSIFSKLAEIIKENKITKLGFESNVITYRQYQQLSKASCDLIPLTNVIEKLRMVKGEEEIAAIRQAAQIADSVFAEIIKEIKVGITELELASEMEYRMKRLGAEKASFDTIVASGPHSSIPHARPTERKLALGDFLKLDFGAMYNGYCSDMTRTIVLGEPSEKQREIYNLVLQAQLAALEAILPGKTGQEIDAVARDFLKEKGYGQCFGHGLGHSVGLAIHESPCFNTRETVRLEPGMVITVEPGIYLPGWGGVRIEDLVVITEKGIDNLTKTTKELIILS